MTNERDITPRSGWGFLVLTILAWLLVPTGIIGGIILGDRYHLNLYGGLCVGAGILSCIVAILLSSGFVAVQPNDARVFLLFGEYIGTCKKPGFFWVNPFYTKKRISLRLHNLNGEKLKVNDNEGNPIEIAAVIVWSVVDTHAACFDVNDYVDFVQTQSESALRHMASAYPYDAWEDEKAISLRSHIDQVSERLEQELQDRLNQAGVKIHEARLSHLAYAPEIAEAMLRRQQAKAVIAARQKIVEGAVSMVQMALHHLSAEKIVTLDEERKAAMISNLLVVLCGESSAKPVINTGTLYH